MANKHKNFVKIASRSNSSILLVGDSIVQGLRRYHCVWNNYFEPLGTLNFEIGRDRIQNILWRIKHGELPRNLQVAVIHCGTINIDHSTPEDISNDLTLVVHAILERKPNDMTVTGILPRDKHISCRHDLIKNVNQNLEIWSLRNTDKNVHLLSPDLDWVMPNGNLSESLYYKDYLHLSEKGNHKLAETLYDAINKILEKKSIPYKLKVLSETSPPASTILNSNPTTALTNTKTLRTQQQDTYSTKAADYNNITITLQH